MSGRSPSSTSSERLVQRIVENVAATRDISPSELSTPLYEAVDPDALGRIQQSSDEPSLQVQFPYEGCVVTIDGAGTITVDRPQSDSGSTALPSELALEGASLSSGDEDTE
ncbi:HalOD1 output domain-containing protein [Halopiger aswanensis]|nr:HalOD1 output domain-containing protein [Halopiger aswanensis]